MSVDPSGFPVFFRVSFEALGEPSLAAARVIRGGPSPVRLSIDGDEVAASLAGHFRRGDAGAIVAGDWVAFDPQGNVVRHLLPRRTAFIRQAAGRQTKPQVVAANMDLVFILMGLDEDFNVHRLARYLTLAHASGASPVVLLTKAGSALLLEERVLATKATAGLVPVHAIDIIEGVDVEAPGKYLAPGLTAALLGSSGVGKSTLLNYLLGREVARTAPTRCRDGKGRHTTTLRELFELPRGGWIIDTPGMRELSLWSDSESLGAAFDDVARFAVGCRFRDCRHEREPGCAVRRAVEEGALDADRIESFGKLQREIERSAERRRAWDRSASGRLGSKMVREAQRLKYGGSDRDPKRR